jgi:hypothetical protein
MGIYMRQRYLMHTVNREEVPLTLEPFGMDRAGIPKALGGTWSSDEFRDWLERRKRIEEEELQVDCDT